MVFYFIYDRKVWLLRTALISALVLSVLVSLKRWNTLNSNDTRALNLRKHSGLVIRNGDQAVVITDLSDTSKAYSYSIQPYLDSCQVSRVKLYHPGNESSAELSAGQRNKTILPVSN
jgi:competence protein ComEC